MDMQNILLCQSSSKRKPWIDALRALAVLFVIYGHLNFDQYVYFVFTSPIKIPLFFAITGYVFNGAARKASEFFKHLFTSLVIPWLALSLIPVFLISIINGAGYLQENLIDILLGRAVWYMPCCIIAESIHYFILKVSKKPIHICIGSIAFMLLGLLLKNVEFFDLFMFNRALIAQGFLLIGYLYKKNDIKISNMSLRWGVLLTALYVGIGIFSCYIYPGESMDVHMNYYYNLPLCMTQIFLGNFLIFYYFEKISYIPSVITFVGQNTLVFYIWSGYATSVAIRLQPFSNPIILFILTVLLCGILAIVLNHWFPFLLGRKYQCGKVPNN